MASESHENGMVKLDKDYLAELEEAAKGRYTEEDDEFMKVFNGPQPKPPIQPAEQFNRNRRGGGFRGNRGRGGGFRDNWQDRRSGGYNDRRQDYGGGGRGYGGYRDDRRQDYGNNRDNRDNRKPDYVDGRNRDSYERR